MRRLRSWIRRLERKDDSVIIIPQQHGPERRFTKAGLEAAYLDAYQRAIGATESGYEEHPVLQAMRNSSDPRWRDVWADLLDAANLKPAEDLSVRQGESPY